MLKSYTTKRLILRSLTEEESSKALDFYKKNDDFLKHFEPTRPPGFYTIENQARQIRIESEEAIALRMLRLWLFKKTDTGFETPLGNFAFSNIVRGVFLSCFLGYKMDHDHLREGYMTEALNEGIRIMFEEYGLHRIEANIMPCNTPSILLAKKLDFINEGTSKDYLKIQGKWEDHIHMVRLNNDV